MATFETRRRLKVRADYELATVAGQEGEVLRRIKGTEIYIARIDGSTSGHGSGRDEWALTKSDFEWLDQ